MDLKKLMYPKSFITGLSVKLEVERESIRNYFATGNIPAKHKELINKAYQLQLKADEKIKAIEVGVFESL